MAEGSKASGRALNKGDLTLIREIATILRDTDLTDIEVERGDLKLRVSRTIPTHMVQANVPLTSAPATEIQSAPAQVSMAPETPAPESSVDLSVHPGAVHAPMVGTAYLAADPDSPPFINIGDTVNEGDTLLLIEAMKTFNPILAPKAGKVLEILVDSGAPVEFGETLLVIG